MRLFLSTYTNKIDKKGRVSVPAAFRSVLSGQDFFGIVAYGSFIHQSIEACGMERMERLSDSIDNLDPYSEDRDAFAASILGSSVQLPFDSEGRVLLPEELMAGANLTDKAVFVGKGQTFEMWEPTAYEAYALEARRLAKERRSQLQLQTKGEGQ